MTDEGYVTELTFKGKEFVYNHHLAVPFRPLVPDAKKGVGPVALDGNLIIHGDNLHALKALLPLYAGNVDCIFIDPPYNTGNEGWSYNDAVNSPMIREWLTTNPVGIEDGLRHEKWCAMMWPRLRLLHDLLSDEGSLWVTLDDNEVHRARAMLDEIFGEENFVATCIWHKVFSPKNTAQYFSEDHDYLLVYAKRKEAWRPNLLARTEEMEARYSNPDNDPRGPWTSGDLSARNYYSEGTYPITTKAGRKIEGPPKGMYWRVSETKFKEFDREGRIWWGADGDNQPRLKRYLSDVKAGRVPQTLWEYDEVGHTQDAKKLLLAILDFETSGDVFITPKPLGIVSKVLDLATTANSIVLDSFAGSATTAHAVLDANKRDGGNRRFIMVETEDYADTLTAERVRRVVDGYDFVGTQKTELLRESVSWRTFEKASDLVHRVEGIENLEKHKFDRIKKEFKNGELIVTGEKTVTERAEGLGGRFTYCTLGPAVNLDEILSGDTLPTFEAIGSALFHMATNRPFDAKKASAKTFYLGETESQNVWLIYKPDLEWLKSPEAALTLAKAKDIAAKKPGKPNLVFAPSRYVSQKLLTEQQIPVEFVPLPFALYRIERT